MFKNAEYVVGTYKPGERQGHVLRTEVVSITVNWLSFNPLALDQTPGVATPPRVLDDFENIVVYKNIEQHCTYELQDRVKISDPDTVSGILSSATTHLAFFLLLESCSHVCPHLYFFHCSIGFEGILPIPEKQAYTAAMSREDPQSWEQILHRGDGE